MTRRARLQHDAGRAECQASAQQRNLAGVGWASSCTRRPDVSSSAVDPIWLGGEQRDDGRDEEERDTEVLPYEAALHTELVERVADASREPCRSSPWR